MAKQSLLTSVGKQIRELPLLAINPKRYAGLRSTAVRQLYWNMFAAMSPREGAKRRQLAQELQAPRDVPPIPKDKGFAKIDWLDPKLVDAVVQEARAVIKATDMPALEAKLGHPHLINVPLQDRLGPGSAIWKLGVDPTLLKVISDYLGIFPVVQGIHLYYSPNRSNVDDTSQFLHLDGQDVKTVKVFVYVEDVDEENGPLSIIPADQSARLASELHYRKASGERRVADEVAERVLGKDAIKQMTGPAGTVYVVDTDRCFHFGSRQASRPRYVLGYFYFTPFAFVLPMNWRKALPFAPIRNADSLSERERYLFGIQKKA